MNTTLLVQQIANGLAIGSVYAIFALGYTLVFSILRIINFAHGAVFTLGAYFTYALLGEQFGINGLLAQGQLPFGVPFPIALMLGAVLAGLVSVLIERLAFRPLRTRGADPLLTLVSSLGVAIAIVNIIQLLFGAEIYSFPSRVLGGLPPALRFGAPPNVIIVRTQQVIIFGVSIVLMVLLTLLINRTKIGKALRAVSEDATTSSLLGINTDRLILFTFFLSGFIGGIAGALVGLNISINGPYFGIAFGLKGLAVIILGGLGDIPGAIVGGLAIGLAEALVPSQYNAFKDAVAFIFLFVVLLMRPQGLLGRTQVQKV
jgi:branched-chain amino acid transport system permease protein